MANDTFCTLLGNYFWNSPCCFELTRPLRVQQLYLAVEESCIDSEIAIFTDSIKTGMGFAGAASLRDLSQPQGLL